MSDESKIQIPIADFAAFRPEPGTVLVVRVPVEYDMRDGKRIQAELLSRLKAHGVAEILMIHGDVEIQALTVDRMQELGWVRAKAAEAS